MNQSRRIAFLIFFSISLYSNSTYPWFDYGFRYPEQFNVGTLASDAVMWFERTQNCDHESNSCKITLKVSQNENFTPSFQITMLESPTDLNIDYIGEDGTKYNCYNSQSRENTNSATSYSKKLFLYTKKFEDMLRSKGADQNANVEIYDPIHVCISQPYYQIYKAIKDQLNIELKSGFALAISNIPGHKKELKKYKDLLAELKKKLQTVNFSSLGAKGQFFQITHTEYGVLLHNIGGDASGQLRVSKSGYKLHRVNCNKFAAKLQTYTAGSATTQQRWNNCRKQLCERGLFTNHDFRLWAKLHHPDKNKRKIKGDNSDLFLEMQGCKDTIAETYHLSEAEGHRWLDKEAVEEMYPSSCLLPFGLGCN